MIRRLSILSGVFLVLTSTFGWTQNLPRLDVNTPIFEISPGVQEHFRNTVYSGDALTQKRINDLVSRYRGLYRRVSERDRTTFDRYITNAPEQVGILYSRDASDLAHAYRFTYVVSTAQDEAIGQLGALLADYQLRMEQIQVLNSDLKAIMESLSDANEHSDSIIASLRQNVETTRQVIDGIADVLESYRSIINQQFELIEAARTGNHVARGPTFSVIGGPFWDYGNEFADFHAAVGAIVRTDVWKLELGIGFLTTFPPTASSMLVEVALPQRR